MTTDSGATTFEQAWTALATAETEAQAEVSAGVTSAREALRQQRSGLEKNLQTVLGEVRQAEVMEQRRRGLPGYERVRLQTEAQIAALTEQAEAIKGELAGLEQQVSIAEAEALASIEKQISERKAELAKAEAEWKATHTQLSTGEWVDTSMFNGLTPEQQSLLMSVGIAEFNQQIETQQAEFEAANIELSTGEWIGRVDFTALTDEQQTSLMELGIEEFSQQQEALQTEFEATHTQLATDEWVDKPMFDELSSEHQALLNELGVDEFNSRMEVAPAGATEFVAANIQTTTGEWLAKENTAQLLAQLKDAYGTGPLATIKANMDMAYLIHAGINAFNSMMEDKGWTIRAVPMQIPTELEGFEEFIEQALFFATHIELPSTTDEPVYIPKLDFNAMTSTMQGIAQTQGLDALSLEGLSGEDAFAKYKEWGLVDPDSIYIDGSYDSETGELSAIPKSSWDELSPEMQAYVQEGGAEAVEHLEAGGVVQVGDHVLPTSEWEEMDNFDKFKLSYGRWPTAAEYANFCMDEIGEAGVGAFSAIGSLFQWFVPGEQDIERRLRIQNEFRRQWYVRFGDEVDVPSAVLTEIVSGIFPPTKALHPFVPISEVTGLDWFLGAVNVALLGFPGTVGRVVAMPMKGIKGVIPKIFRPSTVDVATGGKISPYVGREVQAVKEGLQKTAVVSAEHANQARSLGLIVEKLPAKLASITGEIWINVGKTPTALKNLRAAEALYKPSMTAAEAITYDVAMGTALGYTRADIAFWLRKLYPVGDIAKHAPHYIGRIVRTPISSLKSIQAIARTAGRARINAGVKIAEAQANLAPRYANEAHKAILAWIKADEAFAKALMGLTKITPKQLANLERLSGISGLKQAILDVLKALKTRTTLAKRFGTKDLVADRFRFQGYQTALSRLNTAHANLEAAALRLEELLIPRGARIIGTAQGGPLRIAELVAEKAELARLAGQIGYKIGYKGIVSPKGAPAGEVLRWTRRPIKPPLKPIDAPTEAGLVRAAAKPVAKPTVAKEVEVAVKEKVDLPTWEIKPTITEVPVALDPWAVPVTRPSVFPGIAKPVIKPVYLPGLTGTGIGARPLAPTRVAVEEAVGEFIKPVVEHFTTVEMLPAQQAAVQEAIKAATMAAIEAAIQEATATATQTAVQTVLQQQIKIAIDPAIEAYLRAQAEAITRAATQAATAAVTPTAVATRLSVEAKTGKVTRIAFPLILLPDGTSRPMTKEEFEGSVAWKQGIMYKMIYPPYGVKDIINTRKPIPGVKIETGPKSAFRSIVKKGIKLPPVIQRDMGIVDIKITTPRGKKPRIHFKADPHQRTRVTPGASGIKL